MLEELLTFTVYKPHRFTPHPIYDHYGAPIPKVEAIRLLGLDESISYMMFFGFIRDYKGLDLLIKAAAEQKIRNMNLKFIVAGEFYSDPKPILQMVKELKLEDKFIFINEFISDNDVYKYFCAADAVVQPYKSATQSGVTQIGYHFNKPMLVTNVGGLSEIIPDGVIGYVVEPEIGHIADALVDFYENERMAGFESNMAEEKKKFSWTNMVQTFISVYDQAKAKVQ